MAAFRMDPPKKGAKTAQVKKVAAEKAKATREERHTMGPKQKKNVRG